MIGPCCSNVKRQNDAVQGFPILVRAPFIGGADHVRFHEREAQVIPLKA